MATIKILLFKSKKLKKDKHPVMLRVTKERSRKYFSTGHACTPSQWVEDDEIGGRFNSTFPNFRNKNKALRKLYWKVDEIIADLEAIGEDWTLQDFGTKLRGIKPVEVFQYFEEVIGRLDATGKIGNANAYRDAKNALLKFNSNKPLQFKTINFGFLTKFEEYLRGKGAMNSTISVYLRTLRALINRAIKEKKCRKEDYPFDEYRISKLKSETFKVALSKEELRRFLQFEPDPNTKQQLSKHLFLFSFFTRGMNFSDIAKLKWENIVDGRIIYHRSKTSKLFSVKINPEIEEIINFYRHHNKDNTYIFPILDLSYSTPTEVKNRIKSGLKRLNKHLKIISNKLEFEKRLTSNLARHSWARLQKKRGTPMSVISEGMGHTSERTTQIYLESFGDEVLDGVNEGLLD